MTVNVHHFPTKKKSSDKLKKKKKLQKKFEGILNIVVLKKIYR